MMKLSFVMLHFDMMSLVIFFCLGASVIDFGNATSEKSQQTEAEVDSIKLCILLILAKFSIEYLLSVLS